MKTIRPDLCVECLEVLNWHHNPMSDSGKCPKCKEIYYPCEVE